MRIIYLNLRMHRNNLINDIILNAYENAPTLLLTTKVVSVCVCVKHLYANSYLIVLNYSHYLQRCYNKYQKVGQKYITMNLHIYGYFLLEKYINFINIPDVRYIHRYRIPFHKKCDIIHIPEMINWDRCI